MLLSWNPKLGVKQYKLQVSGRPDFSTSIENVMTDNTAYAPKLSNVAYLSGNQLYWRVAGVDRTATSATTPRLSRWACCRG